MFLTLLVVTFLIAGATATLAAFLFNQPVERILTRLVSDELGRCRNVTCSSPSTGERGGGSA